MAFQTIIVAFSDPKQATSAVHAVRKLGIPASKIRRHPADAGDAEAARIAIEQESRIWEWLFGRQVKPDDTRLYERAVASGATLISVSVIEEEAERVHDILESFEPLRIAER